LYTGCVIPSDPQVIHAGIGGRGLVRGRVAQVDGFCLLYTEKFDAFNKHLRMGLGLCINGGNSKFKPGIEVKILEEPVKGPPAVGRHGKMETASERIEDPGEVKERMDILQKRSVIRFLADAEEPIGFGRVREELEHQLPRGHENHLFPVFFPEGRMSSLHEAAVEKIQVCVMGIDKDAVAIEYYQMFVP